MLVQLFFFGYYREGILMNPDIGYFSDTDPHFGDADPLIGFNSKNR